MVTGETINQDKCRTTRKTMRELQELDKGKHCQPDAEATQEVER
jgi:hypothetical protein